jgi:hypothetical protein
LGGIRRIWEDWEGLGSIGKVGKDSEGQGRIGKDREGTDNKRCKREVRRGQKESYMLDIAHSRRTK